ncbi:MAG: hypothetical protein LAT79_14275, partial [Kiritimatiellae bacterium]|nr:hypothetical protein [Kiritimatiellia bacterium]
MIISADPASPLATRRIQAAIDQTAANGGGRVTRRPRHTRSRTLPQRSKIHRKLTARAPQQTSPHPPA